MPWGGMLLSECRSPEITFLIRAIYLAMVDSVRLLPVYFVPSCFNPSADHKTIPQIRNRIGQSQCVPASQVDVNRPSSAVRKCVAFSFIPLLYLNCIYSHPPTNKYIITHTQTLLQNHDWRLFVLCTHAIFEIMFGNINKVVSHRSIKQRLFLP